MERKGRERERERERESFVFFLCVVVFLPFFVCLMLCGSKHRSPSHLLSPLPILQAFRFIRGAQESYPSIPFVVFFFRNSPIIIKSLFAGQSRFFFFFFWALAFPSLKLLSPREGGSSERFASTNPRFASTVSWEFQGFVNRLGSTECCCWWI